METEGIKSVIDSAKVEAVSLAEMEIKESVAARDVLRERMKLETAAENKKIIASLQKLLVFVYRAHGVRSSISKDLTFNINVLTSGMSDKDIHEANKKLEVLYENETSGPYFISEQIKKIGEQTAKADPHKAVEKALQNARTESAQSISKKAA